MPPQARTLSSALGVGDPSRNMSVEMADVSALSLEPGSSEEERIREKAREAQEQASPRARLTLLTLGRCS